MNIKKEDIKELYAVVIIMSVIYQFVPFMMIGAIVNIIFELIGININATILTSLFFFLFFCFIGSKVIKNFSYKNIIVYLFIYLFIYLFAYLLICLFVYLFIW
ncbi:hypothetical protein F7310_05050 [Francisella uliginis]|uniref:Uncharacterized protein n=1 Tax=Francisella uliginis TaxID=573570 RepID=A0A1L4BSD7_9GAMM|nr:hypothetical protein F7310_05050 [Francisella uliginis]